jgi:hypothetical protein
VPGDTLVRMRGVAVPVERGAEGEEWTDREAERVAERPLERDRRGAGRWEAERLCWQLFRRVRRRENPPVPVGLGSVSVGPVVEQSAILARAER